MTKILLIEDDAGIILPLSAYINKENYELKTCQDGADAIEIFDDFKPNLVILDINLPHRNGIEICEEIRNKSGVPIIVLSARDSEVDKLTLFDLGVDDYVAKPFSARELMARISAILKRSEIQKKPKTNSKTLTFWPLEICTKNHSVTCDGAEIMFTKTEFSILEYCVRNAQNVIKREAIMHDVMGYENYIYDRTIDTHIKNIRKKLPEKISIETIRGIGYRFEIIS